MAGKGGGVNVANAFVTVMPSFDGAEQAISKGLTDKIIESTSKGGAESGKKLGSSLLEGISGIGGKLSGVLKGALSVASVAAAGKAILSIGETFEDVRNTIITGTGASGEALDGLVQSATNVAKTVPVSFEDAASTVADLNTRLGYTGPQVEGLASQISMLGRITGQDVDINKLTGDLTLFGVSADDVSGQMDALFAVSQNTGIGFNDLLSVIGSSGPAMSELGYSMTDVASMAGALDKAGIDANSTLSKMAKALPELAQAGEDPRQTFERLTGEMQNYIAEGNDSAALDIANNLFGTRGAAQFLAAVKSGAMNIDDLSKVSELAGGNIMETGFETMSLADKWTVVKNNFTAALEPLASGVLEGLQGAMDGIVSAINAIDPSVMQELGAAIGESIATTLPVLASAVTQLLPVVVNFMSQAIAPMVPAISTILSAIAPIVAAIAPVIAVLTPVLDIVSKLGPMVQSLGPIITGLAGGPIGIIIGVVAAAVAVLVTLWNTNAGFRDAVTGIWNGLVAFFQSVLGTIAANFQAVWGGVIDFVSAVPGAIMGFFDGVAGFFADLWQQAQDAAANGFDGILEFAASLPVQIWSFIAGIPAYFVEAFDLHGPVADAITAISDAFSNLPQTIWDWISDIPGKFAEMFTQIHIPSFHIEGGFNLDPAHFSVPSLSFYGLGGFTRGTTAIVGERGTELVWPSYGGLMDRYAAALVDHMDAEPGGGTTNVYINGARINDRPEVEALLMEFLTGLRRLNALQGA